MRTLADRQREFAMALLDPALPAPAGLVGPGGEPSAKRFAVYRNNVVVGLIEALQASFPATQQIVGPEFFGAMAQAFVVSEPPTSPVLLHYGSNFPDFIERFEPAGCVPYLSDVARIERAWTEAYHAHEAEPLEASVLAAMPRDCLSDMFLAVHPSVRVVSSAFPALTIWRMNIADGVPAPVDLSSAGEDVLVSRPMADVEVRSVPPGGLAFINALIRGNSVAEATKSALNASRNFDLVANLAALIGAHMFVGYHSCAARDAARVEVLAI